MNKRDVVKYVANCAGVTKHEAIRCIDCYHMAILGAMKKRERVVLVGFGVFDVKYRKARTARSPQIPSLTVRVPARNVPVFRPGKSLKEAVK